MDSKIRCDQCGGRGYKQWHPYWDNGTETCKQCNGTGWLSVDATKDEIKRARHEPVDENPMPERIYVWPAETIQSSRGPNTQGRWTDCHDKWTDFEYVSADLLAEVRRQAMEEGYLLGFMSSCENRNGELAFQLGTDLLADSQFLEERDAVIRDALEKNN